MSETGDRLRTRRKHLGLSADEVAADLGVSRSTIFRYENGQIEKVPSNIIENLAKVLHTTPQYLLGWDDDPDDWERSASENGIAPPNDFEGDPEDYARYMLNHKRETDAPMDRVNLPPDTIPRTVKIYGRIAGGAPIEMIEDVIDEVDLSTIPVKPGQSYFGLRVAGHSMEPDIKDGDYIICLAEDDAESGSIVAVTVNGEDATCKRIMKYEDGIRLLPINPAYDVRYFTNEEITALPVRVLGVVVECRHRFI